MTDKKQDESQVVFSPAGRVCFPHVWEPFAFPSRNKGEAPREPQYSLILVFDEDEDLGDMRRACARALVKRWGDKAKAMKSQFQLPFRPATDYTEYGEPFDKPGRIMINFKSRNAPGVVDARAKPLMNQLDFYPGCWARVSAYAHAYDTMGNKGVTFLLNNVQKMKDDEKLAGARRSAEEEFGGSSAADIDDLL